MNVMGRKKIRRQNQKSSQGRSGTLITDKTINNSSKYQIPERQRPILDIVPSTSSANITPRTSRRIVGETTSSTFARGRNTESGRALSPGSKGSTTDVRDKFVIIAITCGRGDARGEIGMAAIDAYYPHMILCQMSDNSSFINTLTKIHLFQPVEILLPVTMGSKNPNPKGIYSVIRDKFQDIPITEISRMHFNASAGFDRIQTHCVEQYMTVEFVVNSKYYALAAASALFKYVESIQQIVYSPKSMKIEYQVAENITMIDVESAQNLELVTCNGANPKLCLFGALDRCTTPIGRRLLRSSILQPPCEKDVICARQLCVEELVFNRSLSVVMQPIVRRLFNINRLLSLAMKSSEINTVQCAEQNMNYILLLKNTIDNIPELQAALETAKAPFLKKIYADLTDGSFNDIDEKISRIIHPDAKSLKGYTSANMQRCFAIKPAINDMLDISRQAYCELIDDMMKVVKSLGEKYKMTLTLGCTNTLGYHIQMEMPKMSNFDVTKLPSEFIHVHQKNKTIFMTTQPIVVFSQHCKDARDEIHLMSNIILEELSKELGKHIGCLFHLNDNIAELDLIMCLAEISSIADYVKPMFGKKLEVKNSKHPIMDILGLEPPTANDIAASIAYNFHTITGPNMSGKSVYLRQVVLLHIMAQIGCYVPASKAEFRITDRILCRLSLRDDLEFNASTFTLEIKEARYILQSLTEKSLVVLDELCRSTTFEEGSSIAWELCKVFLFSPNFTFSATHLSFLWKLADLYPNVTNHCLEAIPNLIDLPDETKLVYTHKLKQGIVAIEHYGMILARSTGLPQKVLEDAHKYIKKIKETIGAKKIIQMEVDPRIKKNYDYLASVYHELEGNSLGDNKLFKLLKSLSLVTYDETEKDRCSNLARMNGPLKETNLKLAMLDKITSGPKKIVDENPSYCLWGNRSDHSVLSHEISLMPFSTAEPGSKSLKIKHQFPILLKKMRDPNYLTQHQSQEHSRRSSVTNEETEILLKNISTDTNYPLFDPKIIETDTLVKPKTLYIPKSSNISLKYQNIIPDLWQKHMKEKIIPLQEIKDKKILSSLKYSLAATSVTPTVFPKLLIPVGDNYELPAEFCHMRHIFKKLDYLQPRLSQKKVNNTEEYFFTSDLIERKFVAPKIDGNDSRDELQKNKKLTLSKTIWTSEKSPKVPLANNEQFKIEPLLSPEFDKSLKQKSNTLRKSFQNLLTKSGASDEFMFESSRSTVLLSTWSYDEELEHVSTSQTSIETLVAQYTSRAKEAKVFHTIEKSQFDEQKFLVPRDSEKEGDRISILSADHMKPDHLIINKTTLN